MRMIPISRQTTETKKIVTEACHVCQTGFMILLVSSVSNQEDKHLYPVRVSTGKCQTVAFNVCEAGLVNLMSLLFFSSISVGNRVAKHRKAVWGVIATRTSIAESNYLIKSRIMLLFKRIATSIVLFVAIFIAVYFAVCVVGGAISGAKASAGIQDVQNSISAGKQAGKNFVEQNLILISSASFVFSLVLSFVLSFSGILSWCRNPGQPPPTK